MENMRKHFIIIMVITILSAFFTNYGGIGLVKYLIGLSIVTISSIIIAKKYIFTTNTSLKNNTNEKSNNTMKDFINQKRKENPSSLTNIGLAEYCISKNGKTLLKLTEKGQSLYQK